jgi:hypothetical protein
MARLPCLPVELGKVPTRPDEPAPMIEPQPTPQPPPAAPAPVMPPAVVLALPPFPPLPVPVAMLEHARYRIAFGILGQVGEIRTTIQGDHTEGPTRLVEVAGSGEGSILGLGRMRTRVESQFDSALLGSRRWTAARWKGDQATIDVVDQANPGRITLERRRDGRPPERQAATLRLPTFDPIGFTLRVRISPPAPGETQVLQILEGRALWRVALTTAGTQVMPDSPTATRALRLEGRLDPILYDGRPDTASDRPHRTFTLWLSSDPARVPLRLSVPVGIGNVVVELVELKREARN